MQTPQRVQASLRRLTGVTMLVLASWLLQLPSDGLADTQYHCTGMGKTYQNNYSSSCIWYDETPSGFPCYQGIWSETDLYTTSHTASVVEYAEVHDYSCYDYYGVTCDHFYNRLPPIPASSTATDVASTNHYHCGHYSCGYPADVRGWADHQNLTVYSSIWTTSDGY